MKKTFLFAASVVLLASCKKEAITISNGADTALATPAATKQNIASNARIDLESRLEGWLPFEGTIADSLDKLKCYNLSNYHLPTFVAGHRGRDKALNFDGSYAMWTNYSTPQKTNTIAVWVKKPMNNRTCEIISSDHNAPALYQAGYGYGATVGSINNPAAYTKNIVDSNWHHAVITWDGLTVKFYLDAVYQSSISSSLPYGTGYLLLGYTHFSGIDYWKGALDELRIYSRVLTQDEITALYKL